jgi:hypothetical protein
MFTVDEATATAIRNALERGGELSAVAELRRHFPLITDNAQARVCVRAIASWKPLLPAKAISRRHRLPRRDEGPGGHRSAAATAEPTPARFPARP